MGTNSHWDKKVYNKIPEVRSYLPTEEEGGGKAGPYSSTSGDTARSKTGADNLSAASPAVLSPCCSDCDGLGGDWSSTSKMDPPPPQRLDFLGVDFADVADDGGGGGGRGGEEGSALSLDACWLGGGLGVSSCSE